jgi:hypothetical protein
MTTRSSCSLLALALLLSACSREPQVCVTGRCADSGRGDDDGGTVRLDGGGKADAAREDASASVDAGLTDASLTDAMQALDAGVPDAAALDAAPLDVGFLDAAPLDVGFLDAGFVDAAAPDATAPDAAAPDATAPDATAPDAAAPDATAPDAAAPDAGPPTDAGPVGIGVYGYRRVLLPGLASTQALGPLSIAPDGRSMVVAERQDRLRLVALPSETSTVTVDLPKDGTEPLTIKAVEHVAGGVLILANATVGAARTTEGRVYRAARDLSGLAEARNQRQSGNSVESIAVDPRTGAVAVLAQRMVGGGYVMTLWSWDDATRALTQARSEVTSAGCQDVDWTDDGLGGRGRVYVCGINGVQLGVIDSTGGNLVNNLNAGNTSRISARPQGDYALAIGWSGARLYRFSRGVWTTSAGPSLTNSSVFDVEFNDLGSRALIVGGFFANGDVLYLREFRHDLPTAMQIAEVSVPAFSQAPWQGITGVSMADVEWRPGCDAGYLTGGCSSFNCQRGYLIAFEVTNGRPCPP